MPEIAEEQASTSVDTLEKYAGSKLHVLLLMVDMRHLAAAHQIQTTVKLHGLRIDVHKTNERGRQSHSRQARDHCKVRELDWGLLFLRLPSASLALPGLLIWPKPRGSGLLSMCKS